MNIFILVPFLGFIASGILCGVIWSQRPLLRTHKLLGIMLAFITMWAFASFVLHADFFPKQAVWWYSVMVLCLAGTTTAYYHFSRTFANKPAGIGVYLGYGFILLIVVLAALGYYVRAVYTVGGLIYTEENLIMRGLIVVILLSLTGGVFFNFWKCYIVVTDPLARNQLGYLMAGVLVATLFGLTNLSTTLKAYPLDQLGMLLNCAIIAYAISRYKLLNIRFAIRRGLSWLGLVVVGGSVYLVLYIVTLLVLKLDLKTQALVPATLAAAVSFVVIYLLRHFFNIGVERLFYRESYYYRRQLYDFVRHKLTSIFGLEELGSALLPLLSKGLDCRQAYLLLPESASGDFIAEFAEPREQDAPLRIRKSNPVLIWLKRESRYLSDESVDILPEFRGLWGGEKEMLKALGIELLFPLISRDNLIGVLALGKKESGKYSLDDINLVESIASQVAVSFDKEYLQEQLRKREQELSLINRLAGVITSSLNIQEVYDAFIAELRDVVDVGWATIALIKGNELHFEVLFTEANSAWQQGERIPLKGSGTEWVANHKKALSEPDLARNRRFWTGEIHLKQGIRSIVYLPLLVKDESIGSLIIASRQPNAYTSEQVCLLEGLASQIAIPVENSQLYAKAEQRARVDELTRLFNRRHFDERLRQEVDRHTRYNIGMLSLVFLDLDFFKAYNDKRGHVAGDKVLTQVGSLIQRSIRNTDVAFRYGGDEFAIILPQSEGDDAFIVAERVRSNIEREMRRRKIRVTASLGLASWPSDGVTRDELVTAADRALYYTKQTGGNRTCVISKMLPSLAEVAEMGTATEKETLNVIYALAATIEARDQYTYGHSRKVSTYAVALAEAMGLSPEKVAVVSTAALLHDIGKIGIPDEVLNKVGKLEADAWELIRGHPTLSATIVGHVLSLVSCLPAILHHHERWDGTGYPSRLKGEAIPLEGRILAIADAFDAMTAPRPYRDALSYKEALRELKRCSGTQFDPKLVEYFLPIALSTAPEELGVGEDHSASKAG
jgi:diguanylate cyclase (GGDEF)-like protein/putative nucleotidyltransferase with HDIG domain